MTGGVAGIAVHGRWLKHTRSRLRGATRARASSRQPLAAGHGRGCLYLADCEDTVWAEWYRHLAERAIPPLAQMPRQLWTWEVDIEVADLSTAERLTAVGLPHRNPATAPGRRFRRSARDYGGTAGPGSLAERGSTRGTGAVPLPLFRRAAEAKPLGQPRTIEEPPPPPTGLHT